MDRNVNKDGSRNRNEEIIRNQRTQSVQTQPEQINGDVQMDLIGRYTLYEGNNLNDYNISYWTSLT